MSVGTPAGPAVPGLCLPGQPLNQAESTGKECSVPYRGVGCRKGGLPSSCGAVLLGNQWLLGREDVLSSTNF